MEYYYSKKDFPFLFSEFFILPVSFQNLIRGLIGQKMSTCYTANKMATP